MWEVYNDIVYIGNEDNKNKKSDDSSTWLYRRTLLCWMIYLYSMVKFCGAVFRLLYCIFPAAATTCNFRNTSIPLSSSAWL